MQLQGKKKKKNGPENECDMLPFLWWPEGDTSTTPQCYRLCVNMCGMISSPACAKFALRQRAIDNNYQFERRV